MIALGQEQYPHVRLTHGQGTVRPVVELSDKSPVAARIKADQARRLRWLREQMGLQQIEAAELAGVTRFSWYRMEKGASLIDTVALARFLGAHGFSADYVVSGRTGGLPDDLAYDLQARARAEGSFPTPTGAIGCNEAGPSAALPRKSRKRSTAGNDR